jgi:F420-dependent oxidoreductase-like protein
MRRLLVSLTILVVLAARAGAAQPVTFGVQMATDVPYDDLVRTVKLVEELGYDHFWLNDHFMPVMGDKDGPNLESWTLLSGLAAATERIRLGILVSGNTYRHPAVLAKMATSVDHASHGRLNFGLGAGWEEFEHTAYGIPFYTAKERAERLGEALELITRLWTEEHPSFTGKYYQLVKAPYAPKNVQRPHPPIVVGGQGKQWIMPLVARYADEWNAAVGLSPADVRERIVAMRVECERVGRKTCVRTVSAFLPLANITNIPLAGPATRLGARLLVDERAGVSVLAGSAEAIQARIREFVDAGVTSVIITTRPSVNHELMRRFMAEVVPGVRDDPRKAVGQ